MRKHILFALIALLAGFQLLNAIPAYPGKIEYVQPDGTKIVLRQHGDEFAHWTTDAAGRLVTLSSDGYYRPAQGITVAEIVRQGRERRAAARQHRAALRASSSPIALGQKHFLVILVEFSNKQFSTSADPNAAFTALLNEPGYSVNGGTGSARDYYYDNSHGAFEPVFDVYGPVQLDKPYSYYGENYWNGDDKRPEEAIIDGCKKLDEDIDFTRYDNDGDGKVDLVFMYYAGKGEADGGASNTIWPHQWSLGEAGKSLTLDGMSIDSYACTNEVNGQDGKMCGIGTACHEFAHAMGVPDFYDTDYETNGQAGGLFFFSPMDGGSYNNNGRTPPFFNFEERMLLGWLKESDYREFSTAGTYTIPSVNENVVYRTPTDMTGEYFVYESRGSNGWDAGLAAHGRSLGKLGGGQFHQRKWFASLLLRRPGRGSEQPDVRLLQLCRRLLFRRFVQSRPSFPGIQARDGIHPDQLERPRRSHFFQPYRLCQQSGDADGDHSVRRRGLPDHRRHRRLSGRRPLHLRTRPCRCAGSPRFRRLVL